VRRDLLITALIFTAVGFVGGVVYRDYAPGRPSTALVQTPAAAMSPEAEAALPEGHPPLNIAEQWNRLQQQAEANPKDAGAALELANFLFDVGRWDDAVRWYRRALELDPKNTDARTDLGTCYFNLARFDEAIAEFNLVLELQPNKPEALYNLAMARLRQQDPAGARRAYDQLRRNHPNFPGLPQLARMLEESPAR